MKSSFKKVVFGAACLCAIPVFGVDEPRIVSVTTSRSTAAVNLPAQVLAGDEFSVKFDPLPAKMSAVRIGLATLPPTASATPPPTVSELPRVAVGESDVRVMLPKGQAPGIYKLVYTVGAPSSDLGQWKDDAAFLTVWPLPNATVSDISPKTIRPGTTVKVSGTGLSAPASQINLTVGGVPAQVTRVDPEGRWFAATVQESAPKVGSEWFAKAIRPNKGVQTVLWGIPAGWPEDLVPRIERPVNWVWTLCLFVFAGLMVVSIFGLIVLIYRTWPKARSWIAATLVEPKNNTYSLARAQFVWWLVIITWAYMFLFLGRGWVEGIWAFPPLSGFAYTFLISLGTLVAGEATNAMRGVKGAGVVSPSPSDLIMHGGVLALERVQQVMWTAVVGLMFLFITVKTYASSTSLPTIPTELLTLMGFSSIGYVIGKTARKPGPVISSVTPEGDGLAITGENISATGARVQIDGVNVQGPMTVKRAPGTRGEFAVGLVVPLTAEQAAAWPQKSHMVIVTNADEQFAEWKSPPRLSKVHSISAPGADGSIQIVIEGENTQAGTVLTIDDGTTTAVQDAGDPTLWTFTVDQSWPAQLHLLQLENPDGTSSKATWKADSAAGTQF